MHYIFLFFVLMFSKIFQYALKNILRNTFLSISSILVLTLLMFFINILFVIHNVSSELIESINSKLSISLYLNEKYDNTSPEVIGLLEDIKKFSPNIVSQYKWAWELLEDIRKKDPDLVTILERTNPLPNTISLSQIKLDEYESLNRIIQGRMTLFSENIGKKEYFSDYSSQYKRIQTIITVLNTLRFGLYIIIAIFIISIGVIVYSVIGNFVYYYRDEIHITKLVGGSNIFVYGPFIFQGVIYSFVAFFLSTFIFSLLINNIDVLFSLSTPVVQLSWSSSLFIWKLLLFCLIGAFSWFFSSRKYILLAK